MKPIECERCQTGEHLGAVCRGCGTILEHVRLLDILEDQKETIELLELELRAKRSIIKRLRSDGDRQLRSNKHYAIAMRVLTKWQEDCHPKALELSGERLKNVLDRLGAGYTEEQLNLCIFGYSRFPYVVGGRRVAQGSPAQRRIDAELVFRDPQHVDQGLALAQEALRRDEVMPDNRPNANAMASLNGSLSALGRAAVRIAEFGWLVFPVKPREKVPASQNGLLDATGDKERIAAFWARNPEHNIGLRCGIESGLVVLDVDGDEGLESLRALERRFQSLPSTASIVTPRGGAHYYFRHPGEGEVRNTTGFPGPGLDVRGDGGYVLAPPSVGSNGRCYLLDEQAAPAEMPAWLLTLLANRQVEAASARRDFTSIVRDGVASGERNGQLLSLAGHLWGKVDDLEVFHLVNNTNLAKCKPPLSEREVEKIVLSVAKMRAREALRAVVGVGAGG